MNPLDPGSCFPYVLLDDMSPEQFSQLQLGEQVTPMVGQRHILVKFVSVAGHARLGEAFEQADDVLTAARHMPTDRRSRAIAVAEREFAQRVLKAVEGLIVGMSGFASPNPADALTMADILELRQRLLDESTLRAGDKKKSVALSAQRTASSAGGVPAESASPLPTVST